MSEPNAEKETVVELAVSYKSPDTPGQQRVGKIQVKNNSKVEPGQLTGPHADRLKLVLQQMEKAMPLEVDVEAQLKDDAGNVEYVHMTKLVEKGDPLFVPAVREYLKRRRFIATPILTKK